MTTTQSTQHDHEQTTKETPVAEEPRMVTIRQAAELCGVSRDAMRGRVERESVRHVLRDGKRYIPISELRRVGLLTTTATAPVVATTVSTTQLLDRLVEAERRATQAETRLLLTEKAETTLTAELHRVNTERAAALARVDQLQAELEAALTRRRWFRSKRKS